MADDVNNTGVFAQHYRTGKYVDLTLIAKDGTRFNVHRLVVCPLSPVLDAQAADGVTTIDMEEDATTIGQMVKWMYGIDKKLLKNGNSVDEITAMGQNALYHELLVLAYFANTAEKVVLLTFLSCNVVLTVRSTNCSILKTRQLSQLTNSPRTSLPWNHPWSRASIGAWWTTRRRAEGSDPACVEWKS
jgi:hypothetical protein